MRVIMSMTRKEFLGTIVKGTALGAMAAGAVAACGGDDDGDGGPDGSGVCTPRTNIVGNHGHGFTVSRADVDAGVERTYDIMAGADHNHTVTLTASQMATIASGGNVNLISTTTLGHEHNIIVNWI